MIKANIVVNNKSWKSYLDNPEKYFDKNLKRLNKRITFFKKKKFEFTVLLSDHKEIQKLNKKFRKKNKTTDILSFPFYNKKDLTKLIKSNEQIYLGDIIINLNKLDDRKNLKEFKNNFNKLWIHGFLHLFGFKHKKNLDFIIMKKKEKKYFSLIQ